MMNTNKRGPYKMAVETGLVKLALRRDNSYPVGVSASMHCICRCGNQIDVPDTSADARYTCKCGLVIDGRGWIKEQPARMVSVTIPEE